MNRRGKKIYLNHMDKMATVVEQKAAEALDAVGFVALSDDGAKELLGRVEAGQSVLAHVDDAV